jgi:hypothetical protein
MPICEIRETVSTGSSSRHRIICTIELPNCSRIQRWRIANCSSTSKRDIVKSADHLFHRSARCERLVLTCFGPFHQCPQKWPPLVIEGVSGYVSLLLLSGSVSGFQFHHSGSSSRIDVERIPQKHKHLFLISSTVCSPDRRQG